MLRRLAVASVPIALVALAIVYLGVIAGILVLPVALLLAWAVLMSSDPERYGRPLARAATKRADIARHWSGVEAANHLERAAAILEEFVDDGSADDEIQRLRAQAELERARGR